MSVSNSGSGINVIRKASALLDALAERPDATASDLATVIDEPRSSVYRLLAALQDCGLIEPGVQRGAYRLGLKLFSYGAAVSVRFEDIRAAALPVMERVRERTEQTVFLSVRRQFDAFCVERLDGTWVRVMLLERGGTLPLHAGSGPRILLAHEPRSFWREYVEHQLTHADAAFALDPAVLNAELERVLQDGVSISDEDVVPGITSVGAPIFDYTGGVRAALSVSGLHELMMRQDGDDVIAVMREAAAEISQTLGYAAPPAADEAPADTP